MELYNLPKYFIKISDYINCKAQYLKNVDVSKMMLKVASRKFNLLQVCY